MSLYNMKSSDDGFIITKFDDDLNVESSYEYHVMTNGADVCHCPAGQRPSCRHRQMFPLLQTRVDSAWFLDFDTRAWVDPTGEAALSEPEPTTTIEQDVMTGHASVQDEEAFEAYAPNREIVRAPDSHPFRRRL